MHPSHSQDRQGITAVVLDCVKGRSRKRERERGEDVTEIANMVHREDEVGKAIRQMIEK